MTARLPAVVGRAGVVGDTAPPLPALAAAAGDQAGVRFLEFFAAAIRSCARRAIVTYRWALMGQDGETAADVSRGLFRVLRHSIRRRSKPVRD